MSILKKKKKTVGDATFGITFLICSVDHSIVRQWKILIF